MTKVTIHPEDRVTYAEAKDITGPSHSYLARVARRGHSTRVGGGPRDIYTTGSSRTEVEAMALALYRRGRQTAYWGR